VRSALGALLEHGFDHWLSWRGVGLLVAAALLPVVLTGAWTATHTADVAASEVTWTPGDLAQGDDVTLTGTVENPGEEPVEAFNATLSVGRVSGEQLVPSATRQVRVDGLDTGETREFTLEWTAQPGAYYAVLAVDPEDEVSEIEEANNQRARPLVVPYSEPDPERAPDPPGNLTGDPSAGQEANLAVTAVEPTPSEPAPGDNVTARATVVNRGPDPVEGAEIGLQVHQQARETPFPVGNQTRVVDLDPGGEATITVTWQTTEGPYWLTGWTRAPDTHHDPDGSDQARTESLLVQPASPEEPPEPPEGVTLKAFYLDVLNLLHLRFLLPLVALFVAGGVLADDRRAGNLRYLLASPFPRWAIPPTRFVAGYAAAALATVIGLVATFLVVFGTPEANLGFLTTPLLASLVTLLAYGALFTLLGVLVDRPYLVGALFVLGWETVVGFLVPWVENLTLNHWVAEALSSWPLDQGLVWLPEDTQPLVVLVLVSVAAVALAGLVADRREYADA
jgi:hypothetical protein